MVNRPATYLTILICFFAEAALSSHLRIFGVSPEILLVVTVFFGFHFGMARGAETGIVCGVLKDLFSAAGFGTNTFPFLLVGLSAGFLKNKLFKENFVTQFLFSSLAVYFVAGIHFLHLDEIARDSANIEFWKIVICKGLYTGGLAPLLFLVLTALFGPRDT